MMSARMVMIWEKCVKFIGFSKFSIGTLSIGRPLRKEKPLVKILETIKQQLPVRVYIKYAQVVIAVVERFKKRWKFWMFETVWSWGINGYLKMIMFESLDI